MGGRELIGLEAVVPHQQPADEPFVEPASPIRKRRLAVKLWLLPMILRSEGVEIRSADPADCARSSLAERLLPSTTPNPVMPSQPIMPTSMRWLGFVTPTM